MAIIHTENWQTSDGQIFLKRYDACEHEQILLLTKYLTETVNTAPLTVQTLAEYLVKHSDSLAALLGWEIDD